MSAALAGVLALAAAAFALWTYLFREPPVRGRLLLALLRAGALLLLVLLVWNPGVPLGAEDDGPIGPTLLVDASLSMTAADTAGRVPWATALDGAAEAAGSGGRVLLFGRSPRVRAADSLPGSEPSDPGSRLAPALEEAAALGARVVRVVSDFRLEDPVAVAAVLEESGVGVRYVDVGGTVRNAAVAEADGPASLEAGDSAAVTVLVAGEGGSATDSVALELRREGGLLAARRVPLPEPGRPERHRLEFRAPEEEGSHRLEVGVELADDGFAADDRRVLFLEVEEARAGLALLSLRPDWEPRFLLPVLEQATGLEARGFLRLAGGRWLPMGEEGDRAEPWTDARVREMAGGAGLLVLHGVTAGAPGWIDELAASSPRTLLFASDPEAAAGAGVETGEAVSAEWYAAGELPASPLSGELSTASFDGLPPLTSLLPAPGGGVAGSVPLRVRRGRQGPPRPALVLAPGDDGRTVVVLASGFWRWAARTGEPRATYRRLWSAAAGWLLEPPDADAVAVVEPARRPSPRGEPVEWRVRGPVGDRLTLRIESGDSAVVDTTVAEPGPTLLTRALPPGRYPYRVGAPGLDEPLAGELEVEEHTAELLRLRVEPPGAAAADPREPVADGPLRPLRTHPAPYLALIALLCVEWIGRRRQGLR